MRRAAIAISTALIAASALFAGVAQAQDRYGPQPVAGLTPASYAADRPMLNWPGKQPAPSDAAVPPPAPPPQPAAPASLYTRPPEPSPAAAPEAPPPPAPAPMAAAASVYTPPPTPLPPSPPMASLPMRPLLPASPPVAPVASHAPPAPSRRIAHAVRPKPQPASKPAVAIATATPAPAPPGPTEPPHRPWSATGPGLPAHFYSTAREFGLKPDPDPAPLPPQFFADGSSADLAAPPPALGPHPVPGAQIVGSKATANTPANRARAIALDTPSPDGSGY